MSPPEPAAVSLRRRLARGALSLALLAAVATLGQVPFGRATGDAVLRLSLRSTATRIETCRPPTEEELEALSLHMRPEEVCEWQAPPYRLRVVLDGREVLDRVVEAGGLKADRPRIVDARLSLPPGSARLEVSFRPAAGGAADTSAAGEPEPALPLYRLEERVELRPDRITLVQLDDRRGLFVYRAGPRIET